MAELARSDAANLFEPGYMRNTGSRLRKIFHVKIFRVRERFDRWVNTGSQYLTLKGKWRKQTEQGCRVVK